MGRVLSVLDRTPVWLPVLVAVLGVALSAACRRRFGSRLPSVGVVAAAVGVGLATVATGWQRYRMVPVGPGWWIWPVVGAATALAVAAFVSARVAPIGGGPVEVDVVAAAIAAGLYLCLPETTVMELLPGPLVVAALGCGLGWLEPLGPVGGSFLALVFGGLVLVDGVTRGSAVIGGSACLAAAGLAVARPRRPARYGRRRRVGAQPGGADLTVIAVVLVCARVAGLQGSSAVAGLVSLLALGVGAAVLWLVPAPGRHH